MPWLSVAEQQIRSVKITFCCSFLDSFKAGHFQDPVGCRARRKLLLAMTTGQARKGKAAFFQWQQWLLQAYSEPGDTALDSWAPSARWCALRPQTSFTHRTWITPLRQIRQICQQRAGRRPDGHTLPAEALTASLPLAFPLAGLFLRFSQPPSEQLIYLLGNNCSLLALNELLCLAETWECNMSFTKLSRESTDRLQKYALYSVHLNE